jgi:hypothetical protein
MQKTAIRILMALALVGLGWAVGRAQTTQPDFEIVVDASGTDYNVTCAKGCELAWVERGINPNAKPMPTFTFGCRGAVPCSSRRIGGWIRR